MDDWRRHVVVLAVILVVVVGGAFAFAQAPRSERITFGRGASSATVSGEIRGDSTIDYLLRASAGQTMTVSLKTSSDANFFNVLPPGSEAAIAIGSNVGNDWMGTLPVTGDYRIRVHLVRAAARRNESATFTLTVSVTAGAPGTDAKVPGTPYHATGTVACSVGTDPKGSAQCSFGVIRMGSGRADLHLASPGYDVTVHKHQIRVLRFNGSTVMSTDTTEKVTAEKRGETWFVAVNDFAFYEVPEIVIVGG